MWVVSRRGRWICWKRCTLQRAPTITPTKLLLIRVCYMVSFMWKERDILHTRGTYLRPSPKSGELFIWLVPHNQRTPFGKVVHPHNWETMFLYPGVTSGVKAFIFIVNIITVPCPRLVIICVVNHISLFELFLFLYMLTHLFKYRPSDMGTVGLSH